MNSIRTYSLIILGIFVWWFISSFYQGITIPPSEGDSLIIHIPAAQRILAGTIFNLDYTKDLFYPSSIELILALFILLKIPLGLFNIFGVFALFIGSYLLGKVLFKDKYYSLSFSVSVSLLHGIIRWDLTQKPDILMLASLSFILWIVLKTKRVEIDYFWLGLFSGFFVGAKFNSPLFLLVILIPFYKIFLKEFTFTKLFVFLLPFTPIGLSWYLRNIYITGDPFYFPDYIHITSNFSLSNFTIYGYIFQPILMMNAYISEFLIWGLSLILIPVFLYINRKQIKKDKTLIALKFFLSAVVILFISFAFPYRALQHQMVGTSRYILPMIYLLVICTFLIFQKYKKENLLAIMVIPTIIISQISDYHPKLLFPIIILIWIFYFKKEILVFILKKKSYIIK